MRPLVLQANFFKHADRDADAKLVLDEDHVRHMFVFAITDFREVANEPVETRVYRTWSIALVPKVSEWPLSAQQRIRNCIKLFPGNRRAADLAEQKKVGLACLNQALEDPTFQEKVVSVSRWQNSDLPR